MAVLKADAVSAALEQTSGNMAAAARMLGVSRTAVFKFVQARPKLQEVVHDLREGMKDNAETGLHRAVLGGEAWAICFYLKTQAKDRGYTEKQEIEQKTKSEVIHDVSPDLKERLTPYEHVLRTFLGGSGALRPDGSTEPVDTPQADVQASVVPPA